jgi:hypothetical protein
MTFAVLSVHDAWLLGWGPRWCPVGLGYGGSAALVGGAVCASPIVGGMVYRGAEGLQRYTPISTSSSFCEVERGVASRLPWIFARSRRGLSPFWPACCPAPSAQLSTICLGVAVKAAPMSARASASTTCCTSGFSPTRGPRRFRREVNLFPHRGASACL